MRLGPARPLILGLTLVLATLAISFLRSGPPAPLPEGAPGEAFSARRAEAMLRYLLAEGEPHPVGSPADARIRERLVRVLRQLGYETSVQDAFSCRDASCARVQNVIARLPGGGTGQAVLLMAHYDSVAAGPGAGDDGIGVAAVLEVARALRVGPPPARPVVLLIDEGEEAGLLGAQAFREAHPAAKDVGAIVNLDARGTSGPSLMFETSGDNAWLAAAVAGALPHPRTSSVFVTVYERLPNDTDLSVFRAARVPGVNFAFVRDVVHYHTPLDDLPHADPGTLQHHGENALAMVRAFAAADLSRPPPGRAVFFDVLGLFVARWPAPWSLPLAAAAALLVVGTILGLRRAGRLDGRALLAGLGGALSAVLLAALLGLVLSRALRAIGAMPRDWVAHPVPAELSFWLAAIVAAAAAALAAAARAGAAGLWGGGALLWASLALLSAALLPGVSYLFLVPAGAAGLAGLGWALRPSSGPRATAAAIAPAVAVALVDLPVAVGGYDAMGLMLLPLVPVFGALALWALSPLCAPLSRRTLGRTAAAAAAVALGCVAVAALVPTASVEAPERLPLAFYQEAGAARWVAMPETSVLPAEVRQQAAFGASREAPLPWMPGRRGFTAPAAPLPDPGPELEILSQSADGADRRVRARLWSPRGAPLLALHVLPGAGLRALSVDGHAVPQRGGRRWPGVICHTAPKKGVEVELTLPAGGEVEVIIADVSPGLPAAGAALLASRPKTAVTSHEGDVTLMSRRLRL